MSKSLGGRTGGLFLESTVDHFKLFIDDFDMTPHMAGVRAATPMIAKVGTLQVRVEIGGKSFKTEAQIQQNHLTKLKIGPNGVSAETPVPVTTYLDK